MRGRDPLANPGPLIKRVYAYVAYRIGDGPDAEDVTSETIERALRYRMSFDPRKGEATSWLIGIARTCVNDHLAKRRPVVELEDVSGHDDLEGDAVRRMTVTNAISVLDARDRELVAFRYGADLTAKEIGRLLGMKTNAVEVALHRCRERLRSELSPVADVSVPAIGISFHERTTAA